MDLKQKAELVSRRIGALERAHEVAYNEHKLVWSASNTMTREEYEARISACERALEVTWSAIEAQRAADSAELHAAQAGL